MCPHGRIIWGGSGSSHLRSEMELYSYSNGYYKLALPTRFASLGIDSKIILADIDPTGTLTGTSSTVSFPQVPGSLNF